METPWGGRSSNKLRDEGDREQGGGQQGSEGGGYAIRNQGTESEGES